MIAKYSPEKEFYTPECCHILELFNKKDDEFCSIARARVEPGITTQLHALKGTIERYVIIEGVGEIEVGGEDPEIVRPLDTVLIPAGVSQRITNRGSTDLVFLCICTPKFDPECYQELEKSPCL